MKTLLRNITPPFAAAIARRMLAYGQSDPDLLFDGDDGAFRAAVATARVYGEYGCGASTRFVATQTTARILAVDSARQWIDSVRQAAGDRTRMTLQWIDLGTLADWGRPVGYDRSENFGAYTDWIWQQDEAPDCVLVDGRFRVCCFATSLRRAPAGTTILIDDYAERPHYHIVERLLRPIKLCGRQAVFIVPAEADRDIAAIDRMIDQFRFVVD